MTRRKEDRATIIAAVVGTVIAVALIWYAFFAFDTPDAKPEPRRVPISTSPSPCPVHGCCAPSCHIGG